MKWKLQLARDALKTALPFRDGLRRLKRRISGYPGITANFDSALADAFALIRLLRASGFEIRGSRVLEIGSGWFPITPILFYLLGARRIVLTDICRYMDEGTFRTARDHILNNADKIAAALEIERAAIGAALEKADKPADLGFEYQVPFEPDSQSGGTMDLIVSRTVLEHIPAGVLSRLVPAWLGVLSGGGLMAHAIDMSDHFEHHDKSISRINFLRYGETAWRLVNAISDHQNRLRYPQFQRIFLDSGAQIVTVEHRVDKRTLNDIQTLKLAAPFDRMEPVEIATLTSYVVLKAAPGNPLQCREQASDVETAA